MGHDSRAMPKIEVGRPQSWTKSWLSRKTKDDLFEIALRHGISLETKDKTRMLERIWQFKEKEEEKEKEFLGKLEETSRSRDTVCGDCGERWKDCECAARRIGAVACSPSSAASHASESSMGMKEEEKKEVEDWTEDDEKTLRALQRVNTAGAYGGHPYFRGAVINGDQLLTLEQKKARILAAFAETASTKCHDRQRYPTPSSSSKQESWQFHCAKKEEQKLVATNSMETNSDAASCSGTASSAAVSAADLRKEVFQLLSDKHIVSYVRDGSSVSVRWEDAEPLVREYQEVQMMSSSSASRKGETRKKVYGKKEPPEPGFDVAGMEGEEQPDVEMTIVGKRIVIFYFYYFVIILLLLFCYYFVIIIYNCFPMMPARKTGSWQE